MISLLLVLLCTEAAQKTTLSFSRKINTCDPQDLPIQEATSKLAWAYSRTDPGPDGAAQRHDYRGITSVRFFAEGAPPVPSDAVGSFVTQVRNQEITFTNRYHGPTTNYWCTAYKVDVEQDVHVVRMEPIVDPKYTQMVHHILIYECPYLNDTELAFNGSCYASNMPSTLYNCLSGLLVYAWAVGGGPLNFPDHVSMRFGAGSHYFLMEIHYDNPNTVPMPNDNSGTRFYYAAEPRTYDVGIATVGTYTRPTITIPPGESSHTKKGWCSESCTNKLLPAEGVHVFAAAGHTHVLGKSVYVRQVRDGQELAPILQEPYYDFNYQEIVKSSRDIVIFPNDTIFVECVYDSTSKSTSTPFGLSTQEEMCLGFLYYWPKVEAFGTCISSETGISVTCGDVQTDYQPPVFASYEPPTCNYTAPDPARTTPVVRNKAIDASAYSRSDYLDDNKKFKLFWNVDRQNLVLQAAIEVETTGWVGLGITEGGMEGSDIVMGWFSDGKLEVADRFATAKALPPKDINQDLFDISGGEYDDTESSSPLLTRNQVYIVGVGSGVVLVLAVAGGFWCYRKRTFYKPIGEKSPLVDDEGVRM